jgi:hypothetical protein
MKNFRTSIYSVIDEVPEEDIHSDLDQGEYDMTEENAVYETKNEETMPLFQQVRLEQYDRIVKVCRELFTEKNIQYGDSISECGVVGAAVSLNGINARFRNLIIRSNDGGEASRDDIIAIAKDSLVYSAAILMMVADGNWKGK